MTNPNELHVNGGMKLNEQYQGYKCYYSNDWQRRYYGEQLFPLIFKSFLSCPEHWLYYLAFLLKETVPLINELLHQHAAISKFIHTSEVSFIAFRFHFIQEEGQWYVSALWLKRKIKSRVGGKSWLEPHWRK